MGPTTLEILGPKLATQITETTPRITYKGGEKWEHYERPTPPSARTRRFTLLWEPGPYVRGGHFTNGMVQCSVLLRVVTDYAGVYERLGHIVQDDWHQLRDRMHSLAAVDANGIYWIMTTDRLPFPTVAKDAIRIDLTYTVSYCQARP